ncbi:MAG: polysulfide reductase NrfD, partial [Actinobacteria bacterium]|nr:polysulfide reductase NrfD [Actinomycetota bacterium]
YLFTGGVAGGCSVLHGVAKLTGNERLAKSSLYVAGAMEAVSPILLVSDLGRPERFLHMLRVFKPTSPMSVGSWILVLSSGATTTAAALELLGILKPLRVLAELASFVAGPPLATYTGALLANTAIPVWSEARDELPFLFGASACACAGSATAIFTPVSSAGPAQRAAVVGAAVELGILHTMEQRLGFVGEVYKEGDAHRYGRLSKSLVAAGAGLVAVAGRRSRTAAVTGGAMILAGELALRWSVFKAGFQSARDPKYTVLPQRARKAARKVSAPAPPSAS